MTTVGNARPVPMLAGDIQEHELMPVGTHVRDVHHPELTGRIKGWEYNRPGVLSPVPYLIAWDDSARASEVRGWFFVYATLDGVEADR